MLRLHVGFIRLHTVEPTVAEYAGSTVVYMFYTVRYSFTYRYMWQLLLVLLKLHTVIYGYSNNCFTRVMLWLNTVYIQFSTVVECPPLELRLYTDSQVQKAIDTLTDPKYVEVLRVEVDADDREAILKKVFTYATVFLCQCICLIGYFWAYLNFQVLFTMQAAEEKKKAVQPPKQKIVKEVITRGKNKGQKKDVVIEEFGKYYFYYLLF